MRSSLKRIKLSLCAVTTVLMTTGVSYAQVPSDSGASAKELIRKARGSVVTVTGENRSGQPVPPGLGFVIGRNLVATSHRVFAPESRMHVSLPGQQPPASNVSYSDSYRRATIMTIAVSYLSAIPLRLGDSGKVGRDDRVFLFGDPDPQAQLLEAVVKGITRINDKRYIELTIPFNEVISGGPVFNDKGEVIGVFGENPEKPTASVVIPADYLTLLLNARNPQAASTSGSGDGTELKITTGSRSGVGSGRAGAGQGLPSTGAGAGQGTRDSASPAPTPVITRAKAINTVRPRYTEIARTNQTMGVVVIRIVVGADGDVKEARVTKGLPDGLNEQAVEAALQLKFSPATRDGVAVDQTLTIQVEFNLR